MRLIYVLLTAIAALFVHTSNANEINRTVKPFSRIIASPHINLVLVQGETESVRLHYEGVEENQINIEVNGKTLRLYLDEAKVTDKMERVSPHYKRNVYSGVSVTAYVTYRTLDRLEVRGAQEVICDSPIEGNRKFKLKAFGENRINLHSINTDYFKTVLYGENRLEVLGGKCDFQKYKLYGENRIDATNMKSYSTTTTSFGDSDVRINSQDEFHITSFGELRVSYVGDALISKGIMIGRSDINKITN